MRTELSLQLLKFVEASRAGQPQLAELFDNIERQVNDSSEYEAYYVTGALTPEASALRRFDWSVYGARRVFMDRIRLHRHDVLTAIRSTFEFCTNSLSLRDNVLITSRTDTSMKLDKRFSTRDPVGH